MDRYARVASIGIIAVFFLTLPIYMGSAYVSLFTKVLIFALLAMSLDLVAGYAGLWSFCQGALFGVGGYATAVLIKKAGITNFWAAAPLGVVIAVAIAAIFGYIAIRVSRLYFLLITFALGMLVYVAVYTWRTLTGGSAGLPGISYPEIGFTFNQTSYFYFVLVVFVIVGVLLHLLVRSSFGLSMEGVRDDEVRMRALGYNTWLIRHIAFVIGGAVAGVAGMLFVYFNGFIGPSDVGAAASGLVWLMVIMGGIGTLWGAALGGGIIILLQFFIGIFTPDRWPLIIGALFVATVLFLRGGIFPVLHRGLERLVVRQWKP
jgi:branched-chain amino acid transport system permease protein